jgi:DNA-binding CsgD family transcriptional regulator/tetratricopeptide (TPR) repeat protein
MDGEPADVARARFFERTLSFLTRLTAEGPVVLGIEDLHWADRATLDLLWFVVRYARAIPLLLVCTYRTDELDREHRLHRVLGELERLGNVSEISLRPLDRDGVVALLCAIRGDAPPGLVDALLARTEGNPFYVEELLEAAGPDGWPEQLPDTLGEALLSRVDELPSAARHIVRVVSIAGGWIDDSVLALTIGAGATQSASIAVRSGLLVPEPRGQREGFRLRHALLGEAVAQSLLPAERRALHAALATSFEASGHDIGLPERAAAVAHHLYEAHEYERAFAASIQAGVAAGSALAYADALAQFERAIELWPLVEHGANGAGRAKAELYERAAEAAMSAGSRAQGVELQCKAVDGIDASVEPLLAGTLAYRYSLFLEEAGDWPAAAREMHRAIELLPADPPTLIRAEALAGHGRTLARVGSVQAATAVLEEAVAVAVHLDASPARTAVSCVVALGQALNLIHRGDIGRALATAHRARLDAWDAGLPDILTELIGTESFLLDSLGRYDEVVDLALAGRARLTQLGLDRRYGLGLMWRVAFTQLRRGQWDDVERTVETTLVEGPVPDKAAGLYETRAIARSRQGRASGAWADLREWRDLVAAGAADRDPWGGAETAVAVLEGRWVDILAATTARIEANSCRDSDPLLAYDCFEGTRAAAELARVARRDRDHRQLAEAVALADDRTGLIHRLVATAERYPAGVSPRLAVLAAATEAERARAAGRSDPELWTRATECWEALGMAFEVGYGTYRHAEALLECRRARLRATALLRDAHACAAGLGAEPLLREIEQLAQRARLDLAITERQDRSDAGSRDLSARERQVLGLLIEGCSNREIGQALFISEKTASVHVTHIMDKFGVMSRGAAVALAVRSERRS